MSNHATRSVWRNRFARINENRRSYNLTEIVRYIPSDLISFITTFKSQKGKKHSETLSCQKFWRGLSPNVYIELKRTKSIVKIIAFELTFLNKHSRLSTTTNQNNLIWNSVNRSLKSLLRNLKPNNRQWRHHYVLIRRWKLPKKSSRLADSCILTNYRSTTTPLLLAGAGNNSRAAEPQRK